MTAMLDAAATDPWQIIADLQRKLDARTVELSEAQERETATAEILEVINSSPGDLAPVFDAVLEKAMRLCEASFGMFWRRDGDRFYPAALRGVPPAFAEYLTREPLLPAPGSGLGRAARGEPFVHIADIADSDAYRSGDPQRRALVDLGDGRTALWVALRKKNSVLGVFTIYRQEVRPFSNKQIALLQNFAAQAVIAMENARLIIETREALEQQTATAEVLQVINSSPGVLAPVFDAMLERAVRLCEVDIGTLWIYDGEMVHAAAIRGAPPRLTEFFRQGPHRPAMPQQHLLRGERVVQIADLRTTEAYRLGDPIPCAAADLGGVRTVLVVPLRKDDTVLGNFAIYRCEVRPFTDKQISLLQNFAAQAVIAMENARLINETQEALEQQTATAEVLQVINSSPGDLAPVFEAMLEKATRLCEAVHGHLATFDGEFFRFVAVHGGGRMVDEQQARGLLPPSFGVTWPRLLRGDSVVHVTDVMDTDLYRTGHQGARWFVDIGGGRTCLTIALRKEDALLGALTVYRREVRPFTDKQIALLENFAAQAVIAMENARLITETREALEQQTATAEVLQVINSSPGDLAPVFDAMLEKAMRLCEAETAHLGRYENGVFSRTASRGVQEDFDKILPLNTPVPHIITRDSIPYRMVATRAVVHVHDSREDESVRAGAPDQIAAVASGIRTALFVPLLKEGEVVGGFAMHRMEVRPFTDKQIALLENFAAQAVIAMENARLLTETREALEQQTATAEVLQVINSSPGDLAPVFDAMLIKAVRLCEASFGGLTRVDGDHFHAVAMHNVPPAFAEAMSQPRPIVPGHAHHRLLHGEDVVQVEDVTAEDIYRSGDPSRHALADLGGARTVLWAALRKDNALLGAFVIYRQEVRPFIDKQIALLQNFAAQAVIAMENARLLTETREALEQQTATAEVLQVINSSPGELEPVFDAMLEKALRLCGMTHGSLQTYDGQQFRAVAVRGLPEPIADRLRQEYSPSPKHPMWPLLSGASFVHIADPTRFDHTEEVRIAVELGSRTVLFVPLRKDHELLGQIVAVRQEVRPFSDKQIALLQNFAAQAVIAMENARLLNEIRQRQAELRVTFDNMVDGVAMFDVELRLAAWNRNFQGLLDLPEDYLVERHGFDEYIRYLTERGEFGETDPETEINRLRARLHEHYQFERTRPDGTVIEVRHNPMPDGGVVLIYSDITERKRSEAEIHAARDAAEAAYRDLKAAQASLIQAEKMASLGQLTAGIAHEIKNPLNFVNNFADLSVELLDELKETTAPAVAILGQDKRTEIDETIGMLTGNLEKIAEHGRRADGIVKSMLEHSRGTSGERRSVDVNALIEDALNLAYHGARAQDASFNVTLERDFADAISPIELVPQDITRVCLNLIGNGFYAATKRQKEGGDPKFKPTLEVSTRDLGDAVEIAVRDNGTGIAPEIKDKLFQPFFTTKPTGEGTGLGLSISYDIVTQQHGGTIEVDSRVGEFTEFTVRLPRGYRATIAEAAS